MAMSDDYISLSARTGFAGIRKSTAQAGKFALHFFYNRFALL